MGKLEESSGLIKRLDNLPMECIDYLISIIDSQEVSRKLKKDVVANLQKLFKLPALSKKQALVLDEHAKSINSIEIVLSLQDA